MLKMHLSVDDRAVRRGEALALAVHIESMLAGLEGSETYPIFSLTLSVSHAECPAVSNLLGLHSYRLDSVTGTSGVEDRKQLTFSRVKQFPGAPF